jgi:hypothetical protein
MGLFDFFKKKTEEVNTNVNLSKSELFVSISKYNEYIVRFIDMQNQGNYAPIAAYEKSSGEIIGFLYLTSEDNAYSLSAEEVVKRMELSLENDLQNNDIASYTIFYHSQFANDDNHKLAIGDNELKAISIIYHFKNGKKGKIGLPYTFKEDNINYQGFSVFNQEENNIIFTTKLQEGKDYFQDRVNITAPETENTIGIKIKKANNQDLSNTWCGIFGFESYRKPNGTNVLKEHFALALQKKLSSSNSSVSTSQLEYSDINFKAVRVDNKAKTILPIVKTNYIVDIETKEITEWENVENLEAIVAARAKDTYGVWFFATDYAENRELYLSQKKINVHISGIVFVLDISKNEENDSEVKYSEDFTCYFPNKDLPSYGCFDFIGQLEDFRETQLLESNRLKAYILTVRLITNPDIKDFFTIDMYVTPENMRFTTLTKGMKLSGMFQMQGQMVKA